ncbi:hypothetical protein WA158_000224 [Blastocystis sp. Blastoise]
MMKYNNIILIWLLIAFCVKACSVGSYEVTIQRNYAGNPGEVIQLHAGESANLRNTFVFRDESLVAQDSVMIYKVCLDANEDYSLELSSKNSTAWAKDSYVSLMYNKIVLVNSRVNADDKGKKIVIFDLSFLVDSSANWRYSTSVDCTSWKENKIEEFGEDYNNKEIKNAGTSVYFRKDITVDNSFAVLQLAVQSQSGFIVYVNKIQVYTYLLPESSKINENTPSQSLEDISIYKHIIVPKELLASSVSLTTLKIAIELHTNINHPELLSSFDVLTYITNSKDSMYTLSMLASRRLQDIPQYTMNAFEENQSIDFSTILSLSLSNCVLSTDLPTGLTLSSNGILSGTPKEVKSAEYTLSYTNDEDGSSSHTYIFNLQILCNPTFCAHIRVNRITSYYASYEQVIIKSEDGNKIVSLIQGNNINKNYDYYGPVGTWSFELIEDTKTFWYKGSIMTVNVIDDLSSTSVLVTRMRTMYKSRETYYVNTNYSMLMLMKSEWKYNCYDSIPTAWYGSSVDDSTWSTINGGTAIAPTDSNQYFVFHKTINTPSIASQKYFILSYKTLPNTKIYINNHELAVYGFIDGYLDSTDASTIIEQTTTGPLYLFDNQQTISISVLLYDKQHIIDISFDASLLMAVDTNLPIYGDYEVTVTNDSSTSNPNNVVDLYMVSFIYIIGKSDKSSPILSIATKDGYKYINKYCITYHIDYFLYAPTSWKVESIDINGNRHEHSVVANAFNYYTPQRRCFLLSNVTTGINKLEFTLINNRINKTENKYYISEIELFVDHVTSNTSPQLLTASNPYIAYDNTTISILFTNSEYYHDFTITPSLPDGLTFDTTTGSIYGIIHGETGNTDYTIHATSIFNTPYEYTLTINIQSCQFPNNFVNIQFEYEQEAVYIVKLVTDMTSQQIINQYHIYEESSEDYNLCLFPSKYTLTMSIIKGVSSSLSHVYVNNYYYSQFDQTNEVSFFFTQYADASKMSVAYSYDNVTPPKHWTTNLFNDNLWSTVPSTSTLPDVPSDSITQYYRIHYTIEEILLYSYQFDITVSTYAGMIIYINGYEVRRVNMNDGDNIEYNTLATAEYSEYKSYRTITSAFVDPRIRLLGDNIIAIEIHKYNNIIQPKNGLSIVIDLVNLRDSPIPSSWSVNGEVDPEYPLSYMYDTDSSTYTIVHNKCSNTTFTYTYNDELCVETTGIFIYYKHDMSVSYSPESIVIEGNNNNSPQWDEVFLMDKLSMSIYYIEKQLYLNKCYNSYRVRITKCGTDPNISESESESMTILNSLNYFTNEISGCANNEWSAARINQYSYKICPKGYTSNAKRLCTTSDLQAIEGDSTCIKINPSEMYFEETNIIINKNDFYEHYYTIDAVDTIITSSPSLPDGIIIDSESQRIYGTPTIPSLKTTYTLSYTNNEGSIVDLSQISMIVIGLPCLVDNIWPQTNPESTASISCPQYYEGDQSRLCSYKGEWEEPNTSECIFNGSTPCTGTTYYNGNECVECINGYVTSLNGNNYLCTPCNENEIAINNQCVANDATCPASTIDSYLYPETNILKNGIVNCTSENQYGYYKVYCDYISEPTWSTDIHKDRCYPRPVSIPGKALESLDYSMNLKTTIDDIYSLLVSLARTFVNIYSYQLTDLLLTTDYIADNDSNNTLLHAYYGSNRDLYSSSSSSKRQIFLNTITNYTNTPFNSSSVLLYNHTTLSNTNDYCQLPNQDVTIPLNYYYMISEEIENQKELYTTYFCKQDQLNYILIPARFTEINKNSLNLVLEFKDFPNIWIQPDIFISIYRSILISSKVPISHLRNTILVSNPEKLIVYYSLNIPNEVLIEGAIVSNYFNEEVLNNQLMRRIPFIYDSTQFMLSTSN